jgi:hypothetical protein
MYPFLGAVPLREPPLKILFSRTVAYINHMGTGNPKNGNPKNSYLASSLERNWVSISLYFQGESKQNAALLSNGPTQICF